MTIFQPPATHLQDTPRTLLLVVPPQRGLLEGFSTGLVAIANYVRLHDTTTRIRVLDFGLLGEADLENAVAEALLAAVGRVFVGITGTTASYQSMLATARMFKRIQPTCVVVLGGYHVSPQDDIVLNHHADIVDVIVRGEGEKALSGLVDRYPNLDDVPNLSFLKDGKLQRNPDTGLLTEVDLDPLEPDFAGGGQHSAAGKFDHRTYVSARGCPLSCAFCVVRATAIRTKSVAAVIRDLRHLVGRLGYKQLAIEDNFFGHQPKRTLELCAAIEKLRKELAFEWNCQTRVESMRRADVVQAMARAGCTAAYLGVESLVPKHLLYLGKTTNPDRYLRELEATVLPTMLEAGVDAFINLQLGLPGETPSDLKQTASTLIRLGETASTCGREITVFPQLNVIYPGTPHFDMALQKGLFGPLGRDVFEYFTAWENREEPILNYLGEHFAHGVGGIPIGLLDPRQLAKGHFAVSASTQATISTQLRRMENLKGIRVFKYGQYLARERSGAGAA